jgi:hypothetical protein
MATRSVPLASPRGPVWVGPRRSVASLQLCDALERRLCERPGGGKPTSCNADPVQVMRFAYSTAADLAWWQSGPRKRYAGWSHNAKSSSGPGARGRTDSQDALQPRPFQLAETTGRKPCSAARPQLRPCHEAGDAAHSGAGGTSFAVCGQLALGWPNSCIWSRGRS